MRKTKKINDKNQSSLFHFLDGIEKNEEKAAQLKTYLRVAKDRTDKQTWKGLVVTPPGSLLETVIGAFQNRTDIPLEIPFFTLLHYVATELLRKNVSGRFLGDKIRVTPWTIILADSGAGKTYTKNKIQEMTGFQTDFLEVATAAKFAEELRDKNNDIWIRDEFGQFLKQLESQSYMEEYKDILLKIYDGKRFTKANKKETIIVENPALCILGFSVYRTFLDIISPESLLDGFAQRLSFVIAKNDKMRPMKNYPWYDLQGYDQRIKREWDDLICSLPPRDQILEVNEDGGEAFKTSFEFLATEKIPASFFKRIMCRSVQYAILYHVLLKKKSNEIDREDMGWAGRLAALQIQDTSELLEAQGMGRLGKLLEKIEDLKHRKESETGKSIQPRDIVSGIRDVKNVTEARQLLSLLDE